MTHYALVSVGSNIEPQKNVKKCRQILSAETSLLGESSFIETDPVGYQDQPMFLNGTFYLATDLDYDDFNHYLKQVERRLGRIKGAEKSGPRVMDLDIIVWNGLVVHDDYYTQDYVIQPLQELVEKLGLNISVPEARDNN
ncbi:MAG: 2-amino-4-hydroxy-6-hydroxymethyldihydropteridine diphosphokinase [Spongiibacteraceae bacterium]|jgi:2-amino-4-hydroxy-6-hydroxymethyldihydropteridine diphosphokinase